MTHHVPRQDLPADRVGPCDAPAGEAAELLERVRSAVAEGRDEAAMYAIVDEFAVQHFGGSPGGEVGNSLDPQPIRDARRLISRVIGQLGEQPQLPSSQGMSSPAAQRGREDLGDRDEKSVFTEKCLI